MRITRLGIELGTLTIGTFGLFVVVAVLVGALLTRWRAKQQGLNPDCVIAILPWIILGGLVGGRLFYIYNPPPSVQAVYSRGWYLSHLFDLQVGPLAVWSGGLGMAGVLFGASLGTILGLWQQKQNLARWAAALLPGLLLGLVITPWANVVLQQLYGPPTSLPWGMLVDSPIAPFQGVPPSTRFHPTPAYLSLWALAVLGTSLFLEKRFAGRLSDLERFSVPVLLYLLGVFLAGYLRVDVNHGWLGLTGMQALALLLSGVLVALVVWGRRFSG
jgi:phosphatidylglycerol:prolipoprotein diacylglycerol transferase